MSNKDMPAKYCRLASKLIIRVLRPSGTTMTLEVPKGTQVVAAINSLMAYTLNADDVLAIKEGAEAALAELEKRNG